MESLSTLVLMEPSRKVSANLRSPACLGEELRHKCVFSSLGLIPLTLFSICGFTDMASNTAVTQSTLTDSMMIDTCDLRMLLCLRVVCGDTTQGSCSQTFSRLAFAVLFGLLIIYGMGSSHEPESVEFR